MVDINKLLICLLMVGCASKKDSNLNTPPLFEEIAGSSSKIVFENELQFTEEFNTYTYRNFYNGAGVAVGDLNNDGLIDIYFCGNQVDNKLYLNKGDFEFEDITDNAAVRCANVWSTGASIADVNGDGWLDIYVCKSGPDKGANRNNELFINNGDLTFTEKAQEYGIADKGLSNHATFFDYDKDGDLDMYLLNNSMRSIGVYDLREGQRNIRDSLGGNKLYRNDGGHFTDVSEQAGIYGSSIGFGLGVTVSDIDKDGWQDIFVSNDFFERDYLYINNRNGTFKETLETHLSEISMGSMGADIGDINNDGYPEIYVTDMLPESDARIKSKTQFESWDKYALNIKKGYHQQFTRNVLQLNNGPTPTDNSKSNVHFSEIGRFSGVNATDWSWGALILDVNNDGLKDIFVANGIYKDITDQDYINYYAHNNEFIAKGKKDSLLLTRLIEAIPSNPIANYMFSNNGDLTFTNRAKEWGLDQKVFSNGSAYADFDNDGDLDLVVNNINSPALLLANRSESINKNNFLQINLVGRNPNKFAIGAQVSIYHDGNIFYQEQNSVKGYLSTVDHRVHFGLGQIQNADSLVVLWPGGQKTIRKSIAVNQMVTLYEKDAISIPVTRDKDILPTVFSKIINPDISSVTHRENDFIDFDRDRLLIQMLSTEGPHLCVGDVNNDGLDDFFLGGAKGFPGQMYLQTLSGFVRINDQVLQKDKLSEDMDCEFFDADGDGDLDLYVASGGNEFSSNSDALLDRLYINDGGGSMTKNLESFPSGARKSTAFVKTLDYNGDGNIDLLLGTRLRPFLYGVPVDVSLLENIGNLKFKDVTVSVAPQFKNIGMTTDANIYDYDNDGDSDIMIVGEWMAPKLFENTQGIFSLSESSQIDNLKGLWRTIEAGDFNQDGYMDLILGNQGLNNRFSASMAKPMTMYVNDFDQNGSAEQIICYFNGDKSYPIHQLTDLIKQLPGLKKKFKQFALYEEQTIHDIFSPSQLKNAIQLEVTSLATTLLINDKNGGFTTQALPAQTQFSPVYAIYVEDFDGDERLDIILGGNLSQSKPELGVYKASHGTYLKGNGNGTFNSVSSKESGIFSKNDIRDIKSINIKSEKTVIFANNNSNIEIFKYE